MNETATTPSAGTFDRSRLTDSLVRSIPGDDPREPGHGIALCLSGGGYRAMLFHVGSLWRLNEFGYLPRLDRISSVSGGSITAATLGLKWKALEFDDQGIGRKFVPELVDPIRGLADKTIDARSIFRGLFRLGSIASKIAGLYRKNLYGDASLQDLPSDGAGPLFVINATSLQTGVLWRFSKPDMGEYKVGFASDPDFPLADAVAASSAFPPFLSPLEIDLSRFDMKRGSDSSLNKPPYTEKSVLTDGGVYDNLGLEPAFRYSRTVLVSDGGGSLEPEPKPATDWVRQGLRVVSVMGNQVGALRKRGLITAYEHETREGTYWGIRSDIDKYKVSDALPCPESQTMELADTPTRLKAIEPDLQEKLINWGYAICDVAMRKHVDEDLGPEPKFPYPEVGVGSG